MAKLSARGRKEYWRATKATESTGDGITATTTVVRAYLSDGAVLSKAKIECDGKSTPFTGWRRFGRWDTSAPTGETIKALEQGGWEVQRNTSL